MDLANAKPAGTGDGGSRQVNCSGQGNIGTNSQEIRQLQAARIIGRFGVTQPMADVLAGLVYGASEPPTWLRLGDIATKIVDRGAR